MFTAIVAAILGTLGMAVATVGVSDALNSLGSAAAREVRSLATSISNQISKNSQMLSDYKSASADKRSSIINSILSSPGYGNRVDSLRRAYQESKSSEKELTDKVTEANNKANSEANRLNEAADNAKAGLIGAAITKWGTAKPAASTFAVNDPAQNVNGGLQNVG